MIKKKTGYMCDTDFIHHLGEDNDPKGATVYNSIEDLQRERSCCKDKAEDICNPIEVEVTLVKTLKKE